MSIFSEEVVLVQFVQKCEELQIPPCLRNKGAETDEARRDRLLLDAQAPLEKILERNGATLVRTAAGLAAEDFVLVDGYAQKRMRNGKNYQILTFVFRGEPGTKDERLLKTFHTLANKRYEYVTIATTKKPGNRSLMCIVAKTAARSAMELKVVKDPEAQAYGLVVTKSVPKHERTASALANRFIEAGMKATVRGRR